MYQKLFENWRKFQTVLQEETMQSSEYGNSFMELRQKIAEARDATWIFFDTETTGLKPEKDYAQITQIAAIAVDVKNFDERPVVLGTFDDRIELGERTKGMMAWEKRKEPEFAAQKAAKIKAAREAGVEVPISPEAEEELGPGVSKVVRVKRPSEYEFYRPIKANLKMTGYAIPQNPRKRKQKAYLDFIKNAKKEGQPVPSFEDFETPEMPEYSKPDEIVFKFTEFLDQYPNRILVAQNAPFDVNYVNELYRRVGKEEPDDIVVDTVPIFRKFLTPALEMFKAKSDAGEQLSPQDARILKHLTTVKKKFTVSLGKIIKAFDIKNEGWHNALADVKMLCSVLGEVINFLDNRPELASLPPRKETRRKPGTSGNPDEKPSTI
jgi:DNA polymerase III epsilon subunit-like protein